jgi:hypothetical protein
MYMTDRLIKFHMRINDSLINALKMKTKYKCYAVAISLFYITQKIIDTFKKDAYSSNLHYPKSLQDTIWC